MKCWSGLHWATRAVRGPADLLPASLLTSPLPSPTPALTHTHTHLLSSRVRACCCVATTAYLDLFPIPSALPCLPLRTRRRTRAGRAAQAALHARRPGLRVPRAAVVPLRRLAPHSGRHRAAPRGLPGRVAAGGQAAGALGQGAEGAGGKAGARSKGAGRCTAWGGAVQRLMWTLWGAACTYTYIGFVEVGCWGGYVVCHNQAEDGGDSSEGEALDRKSVV